MNSARSSPVFSDHGALNDSDYQRLVAFIHERTGIKLAQSKKVLLEGRLRRRLRELHLTSFAAYCRFLFESPEGLGEEGALLDAATTNKTDFFREDHHFQFLAKVALPALFAAGHGARRPLRVWSAGCSNGAEPYSIAMVCQDYADRQPGFRFEVLASDISSVVLRTAHRAVYPHAAIEAVPMAWRKRFLLRTSETDCDEVRIVGELRRLVTFGHINLMDADYPTDGQVDLLFCRNVLIYFDKPTQRAVLSRLCRYVCDGGYLVLGHSESIVGLSLPLQAVAPTVFLRERSL